MMNWFKKQPSEKELLEAKLDALEEEIDVLRLKYLILLQEKDITQRKAKIERLENGE